MRAAAVFLVAAMCTGGDGRHTGRHEVHMTGGVGDADSVDFNFWTSSRRAGQMLGKLDGSVEHEEGQVRKHHVIRFAQGAGPKSVRELREALDKHSEVGFVPRHAYRVYASLQDVVRVSEDKGWKLEATWVLGSRHKISNGSRRKELASEEALMIKVGHDPEGALWEKGEHHRKGEEDRPEGEEETASATVFEARWRKALRREGVEGAVRDITKVGKMKYRVRFSPTASAEHREAVVSELLRREEVSWVEGARRGQVLNNIATSAVQSDFPGQHPLWDGKLGRLAGKGQLAMIGDTGLRRDSCFFQDKDQEIAMWPQRNDNHRKVISYMECVDDNGVKDSSDAQGHGSHVAGSVAGLPLGINSEYKGLAPDAKFFFRDMQCAGSSRDLTLPHDMGDFLADGYQMKAHVSHNSWGNFEKPKEYITMDAETDSFLFEHSEFIVIFAAGNNPREGVLSPAAAKNVLAVGAHANSESDTARQDIASFSAHGPTFDQRIKPEIVAPGAPIKSCNHHSQCGISSKQGTSMAAPFASAGALLLRQYFVEGWYPTGAPKNPSIVPANSLVKAMLIHSARPLSGRRSGVPDGEKVPNRFQGWGRMALHDVLYFGAEFGEEEELNFRDSHLFVMNNNTINQDETKTVSFRSGEPNQHTRAKSVRVTLVWTDPPAAEGSQKALVNDLDLSLVLPDGTVLHAGGAQHDRINVVEQIDVPNVQEGEYRVLVYGYHVVEFGDYPALPFSLVITAPSIKILKEGEQNPSCAAGCSGHGQCDAAVGLCNCDEKFHHIDCSLCDAEVHCSNHGTCHENSGECVCNDKDQHWQGEKCDECKPGWFGKDCDIDCSCSGRGVCDTTLPAQERTCVCDGNWDGPNCEYCRHGYINNNHNDCTEKSFWCEPKEVVKVTGRQRGVITINSWWKYPNSLQCEWVIEAPPGFSVELYFKKFEVEKSYDWLVVYEGTEKLPSKRRGSYEGKKAKGIRLEGMKGGARVSFDSDLIGPSKGFLIEYELKGKCTPGLCGSNGHCASSGETLCVCKGHYDPNRFCTGCQEGWAGALCEEEMNAKEPISPPRTPLPTTPVPTQPKPDQKDHNLKTPKPVKPTPVPTTAAPVVSNCVDKECRTCVPEWGGRLCRTHCAPWSYTDPPSLCSGNGDCLEPDLCTCRPPWGGLACQVRLPLQEVDGVTTVVLQPGQWVLASLQKLVNHHPHHTSFEVAVHVYSHTGPADKYVALHMWDLEEQAGLPLQHAGTGRIEPAKSHCIVYHKKNGGTPHVGLRYEGEGNATVRVRLEIDAVSGNSESCGTRPQITTAKIAVGSPDNEPGQEDDLSGMLHAAWKHGLIGSFIGLLCGAGIAALIVHYMKRA